MAHFPLFINIKDRKCLVIGGGRVARRKIETLLLFEADVRVFSPQVCEEILALFPDPEKNIQKEPLTVGEMEREIRDAALVVAAAGNREANRQTAEICHRLGIPVNVADEPRECTFLFPAVVKKGDISIGINTGGQSPVVSGRIRREIGQQIPDYYADIAGQLGELRTAIRGKLPKESDRRRLLRKAAALAFHKERVLSQEEIEGIFRKLKETPGQENAVRRRTQSDRRMQTPKNDIIRQENEI